MEGVGTENQYYLISFKNTFYINLAHSNFHCYYYCACELAESYSSSVGRWVTLFRLRKVDRVYNDHCRSIVPFALFIYLFLCPNEGAAWKTVLCVYHDLHLKEDLDIALRLFVAIL